MIPARPTVYRGIQMRSRMEADHAAFLDDAGFTWRYEPRAYGSQDGQYLPDFELIGLDQPTFVEVKPTMEAAFRAMARVPIILDSVPNAKLMISVWPERHLFMFRRESRTWRSIHPRAAS